MNDAPSTTRRPLATQVHTVWTRALLTVFAAAALLTAQTRLAAQPGSPPTTTVVNAARQAKNVVVITIDRMIDRTMAASVQRRMKEAAAGGADAIVFDINTPGGDVGAVLEICNLIKTSPVRNTVAWVHNMAYSGGAIIALACREIVVSNVARMGDAAPIVIDRLGRLIPLPETERQKMLAPLLAEVVDSARRNGYDEKLVQGIISRGVELWLIKNKQTGQQVFIDRDEYRSLFGEPSESERVSLLSAAGGPAEAMPVFPGPPTGNPPPRKAEAPPGAGSPTDFLPASPGFNKGDVARDVSLAQRLPTKRPILSPGHADEWTIVEKVSDGKGIFLFNDSQMLQYGLASPPSINSDDDLRAFFGAVNIRRLDQSWSESLVLFLQNPIVFGLVVAVFLISLFIELTHPGLILPGTVAALALFTLIAPAILNDMASWWMVAAILGGLICLGLEAFVLPGFGVFGVLGILLLFGGLVGTFVGGPGGLFPDSPEGKSNLLYGAATVLISASTSSVAMYFIAKHFGSLPFVNRLVLKDERESFEDGLLAAMEKNPGGVVRPGAVGIALTPLRPAGRVQIGDKIVDVVSDMGFVPTGGAIRVLTVDHFRVSVEPIPEAVQPPHTAPTDGGETA